MSRLVLSPAGFVDRVARAARLNRPWVLIAGWLLATGACGRGEVAVYGADPFARDPAPLGPLAGKIVACNTGDDTLSVVDPALPGPAGRLPVGLNPVELEGPTHLCADPAGRFLFVNLSLAVPGSGSGPHGVHGAGDQPGFVLKLDTQTGQAIDRVQVDPNPGDNVLSVDGHTLYVTHHDDLAWRGDGVVSRLAVIDVDAMVVRQRVPLCPAAHGLRLSRAGTTLYATCGPDQMAIVDLGDARLPVRLVQVPGGVPADSRVCQRCPYALAVAPDDSVWLSALGPQGGAGAGAAGSVEIFDPAQGAEGGFDPARRIDLSGQPMFAAFVANPGGGYRALIPEQGGPGDAVHVFSSGGAGVAPVRMGGIALDPTQCLNGHMLVVAAPATRAVLICEGDHRGPGSVVWLDLTGPSVLGAVPAGVFPNGMTLVPPLATP
jgi:DNA-binding beta-propeller fold protein YncE